MDKIVLIVHVLAGLAIIGLILLQQGKGAAAGASFGAGASQTVFGSQGGGSFFARATAIVAALFFITSFSLAVIAKNSVAVTDNAGLGVLEEVQEEVPAIEDIPVSDVPVLDAAEVPAASEEAEPTEEVPATTP